MIPYAEPLAHEIMARRPGLFVDVRNPRHGITPFPCTAYDVFTHDALEADPQTIGELAIWHYFHGEARDADGRRLDPSPLRINRVEYRGDVPGFGNRVLLVASEFPEYSHPGRIPDPDARENFTPEHQLFRLDRVPIRFVAYEIDSEDRARYLAWVVNEGKAVPEAPATSHSAF